MEYITLLLLLLSDALLRILHTVEDRRIRKWSWWLLEKQMGASAGFSQGEQVETVAGDTSDSKKRGRRIVSSAVEVRSLHYVRLLSM